MNFALGDYDGETEFIVAVNAPWFSGLRKRVYDIPTTIEKIPVEVRKFDTLFLNLPKLNYIKVDAEGGEYHIFKGASQCLDRFRPLITFEFGANSIAEYKITAADMAQIWFEKNYKLFSINGGLIESREEFVQCAETQHFWDYVAIPAENQPMRRIVQEVLKIPAMS